MRLVSKEQFSSDINEIADVLVMLSSDALSPCYVFDNTKKQQIKLPSQTLRDILLWIANSEGPMPELFFLAGADTPLEEPIASVLKDMSDHIVTPLLSPDMQKNLNIPFSRNQTVIATSLQQLMTNIEHISGRPIIVHIEQKDIDYLAESILIIHDYVGNITMRLRNIHLLTDSDIQAYKRQFADITDVSFMKKATRTEGNINILNLGMFGQRNDAIRCPAGMGFITIGPDGRIYPCPAFYSAGEQYSLGTLKDMVQKTISVFRNEAPCGICNSIRCPGCFFLQSTNLAGKEKICKIYEAEQRSMQEMLQRVAHSGYMFDCLRTLKGRECAVKSQAEGGEAVFASQQVNSITFTEFTNALCDLKLALESIIGTPSEKNNYNSILCRWTELSEIPKTSQRNVFRRRMREILTDIQGFNVQSGQDLKVLDIRKENSDVKV